MLKTSRYFIIFWILLCLRLWISFYSDLHLPFSNSFHSSTVLFKSKHQSLVNTSIISVFSRSNKKTPFPKLTLLLMSSQVVALFSSHIYHALGPDVKHISSLFLNTISRLSCLPSSKKPSVLNIVSPDHTIQEPSIIHQSPGHVPSNLEDFISCLSPMLLLSYGHNLDSI